MNRQVVRLWRGALALVLASVTTVSLTAAASGGSPRYADYGQDQPNQPDQCAFPPPQQSGGWVCWSPAPSGP